jgi:RNA polymerase subunit RPABC4/transcription elongation factor Spt4
LAKAACRACEAGGFAENWALSFVKKQLKRPIELAKAACRACEAGGFAENWGLSLVKKQLKRPNELAKATCRACEARAKLRVFVVQNTHR